MALASLLLTTLPPAVLPGLRGPQTALKTVCAGTVLGDDAGPPLMGGWSLCIFFPVTGMALQNRPHPCLVLVIHVHKMANQGEEGSQGPGRPLAAQ